MPPWMHCELFTAVRTDSLSSLPSSGTFSWTPPWQGPSPSVCRTPLLALGLCPREAPPSSLKSLLTPFSPSVWQLPLHQSPCKVHRVNKVRRQPVPEHMVLK